MTTSPVLAAIDAERQAQHELRGDQHLQDGTSNIAATRWQREFDQALCEDATREGRLTWQLVAQEEISEAFAETDPALLRAELIQAAAVLVAWVEDIDSRG